jgi:hypothetical protein
MSNLLDATRKLLSELAEVPLAEIARGAGRPVAYDWLKRFAADEIPDPSVNRVQHLHDFLVALKRKRAA